MFREELALCTKRYGVEHGVVSMLLARESRWLEASPFSERCSRNPDDEMVACWKRRSTKSPTQFFKQIFRSKCHSERLTATYERTHSPVGLPPTATFDDRHAIVVFRRSLIGTSQHVGAQFALSALNSRNPDDGDSD